MYTIFRSATRSLHPTPLISLLTIREFSSHQLPSALKSKLRELYKKIHPDAIHFASTEARQANQRSFALLQDYIDAAVNGEGIGRTAGLPYNFKFYIRKPTHDHSDGDDDNTTSSADNHNTTKERDGDDGSSGIHDTVNPKDDTLHMVTLTLPPPSKGNPVEVFSPATRRALSRLLLACGLTDDWHPSSSSSSDSSSFSRQSLRDFIPAAAELLHQAASQGHNLKHTLSAIRTALRLSRGITGVAITGQLLTSKSTLQQIEAMEKLVTVLSSLPDLDISGLRLGLGDGYAVDAVGTIWLLYDGSTEAWFKFLSAVDIEQCRQRLGLLGSIHQQEVEAARRLGVALVHTPLQHCLDGEYMEFLLRVIGGTSPSPSSTSSSSSNFAVKDVAKHVSLSIQPSTTTTSSSTTTSTTQQEQQQQPTIGDSPGSITIPATLPLDQLLATITKLGPQAAAAAIKAQHTEEDLKRLRTQVERRLRLRRLLRDPSLPEDKFRACCTRLIGTHVNELLPLLEGLAVRIGWVNGIAGDREYIEIAWDYRL